MLPDFIYWPFTAPVGIKLEFIAAEPVCKPSLWLELAYQIYSENGKDTPRELGHYPSGAPFLHGSDSRISITHTSGLLAVATLPRTPEANLIDFSERTALGIDAENIDREQAKKCLEKFIGDEEKNLVDADSVVQCVLVWTIKEALYKAALTPGLDFRKDIRILKLPKIQNIDGKMSLPDNDDIGAANVMVDGKALEFLLYSMQWENHIVTLAYSPKGARFSTRHK